MVKVPTIGVWSDPNCVNGQMINGMNMNIPIDGINKCTIVPRNNTNLKDTLYEAHIYTVEFQTPEEANGDNLAMITRENGSISLKIPYQLLGFSDPSSHLKTFFEGLGRDFNIIHSEYREDVNFEFSYSVQNTQYENSHLHVPFNWEDWGIPEYWMIKPKQSFNAFRRAFHEINNIPWSGNLSETELSNLVVYNNIPNRSFSNIHFYIVRGAIFILLFFFISASIVKLVLKDLLYCYSSKRILIGSYRLICYNILASIALVFYLWSNIPITNVVSNPLYFLYIILVMWDSILLLGLVLFNKWNLYEKIDYQYDTREHAFIIACHNSSDVLEETLKSLLSRVPGSQIYIADNGSSIEEQEKSKMICETLDTSIHYGHISFDMKIGKNVIKRGNKTMAQYASICSLDKKVKYATCIDDDTRLHETWDVNKVIHYFKSDENVVVLAYPLTADNPQNDIEWFQAMEYLISGFFKIFHSKVYSTIFNSGAFGTYRVDVVKEAFLYHNTDYHGDDLQICMNIHQLKGKTFYNSERKHVQNYKVVSATNMVGSTIVPKCWIHASSLSSCFKNNCDCGNPDLLQQRSKGWFVSKHRFIPKYIYMILNVNGIHGLWVRLVALYELIIILNEYFAIVYIFLFINNIGWWLVEGFLIGYAFTILVMVLFDFKVLQKNNQYIPFEFITMQPIVYKLFMITIYRYLGLFYNLFIYSIKHKSGTPIIKRLEDKEFRENIADMYKMNDNV